MINEKKPKDSKPNYNGYADNEAVSDYENATSTELEQIRAVMRLSGRCDLAMNSIKMVV